MIIDETPIREQIQDLTIASWIVIDEEQLIKINLGTKENMQQVKVNLHLNQLSYISLLSI
jgi:hypothetical protein